MELTKDWANSKDLNIEPAWGNLNIGADTYHTAIAIGEKAAALSIAQ